MSTTVPVVPAAVPPAQVRRVLQTDETPHVVRVDPLPVPPADAHALIPEPLCGDEAERACQVQEPVTL